MDPCVYGRGVSTPLAVGANTLRWNEACGALGVDWDVTVDGGERSVVGG